MTLIKDKQIIDDPWCYLSDGHALKASHTIIDPDFWHQNKRSLSGASSPLGLMIPGDQELAELANDLTYFSLIAIHIPTFVDGRAYSLAKLLRERYHYKGEVRAVGDVLPDQAHYLTRVGFDALEFTDHPSASLALKKLSELSVCYQPG
jgi:uncharacterized protein (DUF934 family)|tara:strand:+ start:18025 stop:18471 length:447 start_codon:yes stop_codon:yes gene_type:complete